jgi:ribulose-phosphate 3-epimerase
MRDSFPRVTRPIRIAPSILSADFARLGEQVRAIDKAGADYIHVDVMDGHFVPNITIGPMVVAALRRVTDKPLDVHLMIDNPDRYIPAFADAGADIIGVHVETCPHLHRTVQSIVAAGRRPCVVVNPATPLHSLPYVLDQLAMVLIMGVNPGFGGQAFIPAVLDKIREARAMIDERGLSEHIDIEVDGGIKLDNVAEVAAAGANVMVSGSGIFKADDYAQAIAAMRARAESAR